MGQKKYLNSYANKKENHRRNNHFKENNKYFSKTPRREQKANDYKKQHLNAKDQYKNKNRFNDNAYKINRPSSIHPLLMPVEPIMQNIPSFHKFR